jgi:Domain of unknown function (DUF4390)
MTAFSTRCCERCSWVLLAAALWIAFMPAAVKAAEGIEVKSAALVPADDGYYLDATFEIMLPHALEDALNKGVPLHFLVEFELIRPRWYWLNEKVANLQQRYRFSYNALTRQYRVGVGTLYQNFASLAEALEFMNRVRLRDIAEPGALRKDSIYTAGLRMRLDTSQLPRPFQISALGSRDWNISSDWYRWTVAP